MQQMWIVILIAVAAGYGIAFTRKGSVRGTSMPGRQESLSSPASPADVLAALKRLGAPYAVDDADDAAKIVVLSSPVTLFSWGFFYPVYVSEAGTGSRIVVGCSSKLFQMGPVVTNAHRKCIEAIEAALGVAQARVVNG